MTRRDEYLSLYLSYLEYCNKHDFDGRCRDDYRGSDDYNHEPGCKFSEAGSLDN